MKLLFVISSLNTGGAQRVLSNIVTNLPQDEWDIDILLNNAKNITFPYRGNLIDLKIPEPSDRRNIFYQMLVLLRRYVMLKKLKKERSYNACISFLESANIVNVITGKKYCKTIVTVHCTLSKSPSPMKRYMINPMLRFFYNRADNIVTVSRGVRNDLVCNLGIREELASAIYNGFHIEDIRSQAGTCLADRPFTFINMGRCEKSKGQWHLIRAFAAFVKEHKGCRLVILGDGSYQKYCEQLISAYQLEDVVLLKGFINNPYKELANADVLVFPSLFEGFGNALIEAMACELPIIASDFRFGAREILAPDTDLEFERKTDIEPAKYGIIIPVCSGIRHSPEQPLEFQETLLLKAMESIYNDENMRNKYRQLSLERAMDFSIEHIIKRWYEIIE